MKSRILVLAGHETVNSGLVDALSHHSDVVQVQTIDDAIKALRSEHFTGIFSDAGDFLPLERALVSQQANLILNTVGEGVCIIDGDGRCNWMNKKMQAWPARVHEAVRRSCQEAFTFFSNANFPADSTAPRSRRFALNIDDQQFLELVASPVVSPRGQVVQVVAVVWDATGSRRLQQRVDSIDRAGRELMRLESDAMVKMNVGQRLKFLEDKIISHARQLLHFDHFAIRLLDRKTQKLELVISSGLPTEALNVELFADAEGNGISGYVAATGKSYLCPDVERDPRYVMGLDSAKSSLTVPLFLHDKVIGIFNIESRQRAAFTEDDKQFAEIFGRYVAVALNILDLMVFERVNTSHKVADDVTAEMAGPLNDIALDCNSLLDEYIGGNEDLRQKLRQILGNVEIIQKSIRQVAEGPNTSILGAQDVKGADDPVIGGARVLVADDEPNIRNTIADILRKYHAHPTVVTNGAEAIAKLESEEFDLVVSDIRMPDKSGYDVFCAARKKSQSLPVILMTGFGYDPNHCIVRASQEGLSVVLFKPFKVDQLLAEVRKALQSQPVVK